MNTTISAESAVTVLRYNAMKDHPEILLVDDDENIRRLVQLYLEKEGFAVRAEGRGDAASRPT